MVICDNFGEQVDMRTQHLVLVAAFLAVDVSQASASILSYTYTGMVAPGTLDTLGLFGDANANIGGAVFTDVEIFDTTKGGAISTDDSTFSQQSGGSTSGFTGFVAANFRIGSAQAILIGDDFDLIANFAGSDSVTYVEEVSSLRDVFTTFDVTSGNTLVDFSTPNTFTAPSDTFFGTFSYQSLVTNDIETVDLVPTLLVVSNGIPSVPLPASAPLFGGALLAFSAFGLGMRRNARASA